MLTYREINRRKHRLKPSLCHRSNNFNLSQLVWALQEYSARNLEIVDSTSRNLLRLRRKAECAHLSPPAESRAFSARASRSIFLAPSALVFWVNRGFSRRGTHHRVHFVPTPCWIFFCFLRGAV